MIENPTNIGTVIQQEVERLKQEIEVLKRDKIQLEHTARTSLANNLCPDHRDKQQGKPCLACTIETLHILTQQLYDAIPDFVSNEIKAGVRVRCKAVVEEFQRRKVLPQDEE